MPVDRPRRSRLSESSRKNRSTTFNHEAEVGAECRLNRGCLAHRQRDGGGLELQRGDCPEAHRRLPPCHSLQDRGVLPWRWARSSASQVDPLESPMNLENWRRHSPSPPARRGRLSPGSRARTAASPLISLRGKRNFEATIPQPCSSHGSACTASRPDANCREHRRMRFSPNVLISNGFRTSTNLYEQEVVEPGGIEPPSESHHRTVLHA